MGEREEHRNYSYIYYATAFLTQYTKLTFNGWQIVFLCFDVRKPAIFIHSHCIVHRCVHVACVLVYKFHFWISVAVATIASYYPTDRKPFVAIEPMASFWMCYTCMTIHKTTRALTEWSQWYHWIDNNRNLFLCSKLKGCHLFVKYFWYMIQQKCVILCVFFFFIS